MMKAGLIVTLLFLFCGNTAYVRNLIQDFDKPAFYAILKSGKIAAVNEELTLLASLGIAEKEAYEGALLVKKANLVKLPVERLKLFKKGRLKLEAAILNDNENGEYHFLQSK